MKGRRVRLTDAGVGRLKPHTTEYAVWDSEVSGLGVRVRPSGHRSFVWHRRVQGEPVRATVGPAALMTVEDARKRALALSVGNAPRRAEGRSGIPLFRDFVLDEWLPAYRRRCAPSSCQFANRVLKGQLIPAFGRLPLDAIRRIDVERWFDAYSRTAPGGANKALEVLGQIMNAALAAGHAGTTPVKGIAKNPPPETHPVPLRRRDRKASPRPRSAGRGAVLAPATGRRRSIAPAHRLPEGRDPEAPMVGGRRRPTQPRRHQDRAAKGLVEPGRAGHPRPPAACRKPLRVPVPEVSGTDRFRTHCTSGTGRGRMPVSMTSACTISGIPLPARPSPGAFPCPPLRACSDTPTP